MRALLSAIVMILVAAWVAPSAQAIRVAALPERVAGNPADRLAGVAPDEIVYDRATRCRRTPQPGMVALQRWLEGNADGVSWGTFRCERWGEGGASLHAEGRAIDWHLDTRDSRQKAAGKRLIALLLATDRAGTPQALARRMGVQEIIWDCSYWSAGSPDFGRYAPCFAKDGQRRRKVNATVGHLDHLHIGITKAAAKKRTSFWRAGGR